MPKLLYSQILLLVCVWACLTSLVAQPRVLPPVEIGSDVQVRAPLIKKPVPLSQDVPADTIPPQIPPVFSQSHRLPQSSADQSQTLHLELITDTSVKTSLTASYNPTWSKLPLLKLHLGIAIPATSFANTWFDASIQTKISNSFKLNHLLSWQQSQAPDFQTRTASYSLYNVFPNVHTGALNISEFKTRLSLEGLTQSHGGAQTSDFALGLSNSHELQWRELKFTNRLVLQDTALAMATQLRLPWLKRYLPELDLGLMTDFIRVLPAIELHKRVLLGRGGYLEISNRTELRGSSFGDLSISYPWSLVPQHEQIGLTPLNLTLAGWKSWNNKDALFLQTGVQHNLRFSRNQPELHVIDAEGQTSLSGQDIFSYRLGGNLRLRLFDWKIEQDLELNLEYRQVQNWLRRPFSPLLRSEMAARYRLGDLNILATLNQQYWCRDELDQPLPATVDLGLGLEYPVRQDLRLSASLDNIFNSSYPNPGNLPGSNRRFSLKFNYLPPPSRHRQPIPNPCPSYPQPGRNPAAATP